MLNIAVVLSLALLAIGALKTQGVNVHMEWETHSFLTNILLTIVLVVLLWS